VTSLIELIGDNKVLKNRGLQLVLDRYALIPTRSPHPALKDCCVNAWGNPWLPSNEYQWEGVSDAARQMVGEWLKLEFIELFFTKLAQDGLSDTRRLKFWARYVPLIENIYFALGSHVMESPEQDFVQLREKLADFTITLDDHNPLNNAFVMTMGDLVAVEFSGESNALYGYSVARSLPFDISKPVRSSPVNGNNSLKNDSRVLYLRHQDNVHGYQNWEERFKNELHAKFGLAPGGSQPSRPRSSTNRPLPRRETAPKESPVATSSTIGSAPPYAHPPSSTRRQTANTAYQASNAFSEQALQLFANRFNAKVIDRRRIGGALWVVMDDRTEARQVLKPWGFRYAEGKGWWNKDPR
jgi:hypothetical protein